MLWLQLQETLNRNGNSASTRACCEAVPAPASSLAASGHEWVPQPPEEELPGGSWVGRFPSP